MKKIKFLYLVGIWLLSSSFFCKTTLHAGRDITYEYEYYSVGPTCCVAAPGYANVIKTTCSGWLFRSCSTISFLMPASTGASLYASNHGCTAIAISPIVN